jgi:hypothetical protein
MHTPINAQQVLSTLKDFQRLTVDYVFHRMYEDAMPTRRFLVADEVGLGKTLVARGIIARTIEHLQQKSVPRIDVIYICSNQDIAQQNLKKLNILEDDAVALPSRITLLPLTIQRLQKQSINFVSLTPDTSLRTGGTTGIARERALIYHMLPSRWKRDKDAACDALHGPAGVDSFRETVQGMIHEPIEQGLRLRFVDAVTREEELRVHFLGACRDARRNPQHVTQRQKECIRNFRRILAKQCMDALEPDLIILDEFQRFKDLLDPERSEASELAHQLFQYSDAHNEARVLLLSATPYKMYTLAEEGATDQHYADFMKTLGFLFEDNSAVEACQSLFGEYRQACYQVAQGGISPLRQAKVALETRLRQVMVRTERLGVTPNRDGMLVEIPSTQCTLSVDDLLAYRSLSQVASAIDADDPLEYWKSAPYLLNFMENYRLKQLFQQACAEGRATFGQTLTDTTALLPLSRIRKYAAIDPGNARLRALMADTVENDLWQCLWMPPALPYYVLEGPFAKAAAGNVTKRLIFSSWQVAPKAIASMVSYEVERRIVENSPTERPPDYEGFAKRTAQLLRIIRDPDGRLTGMPVLGMLYPCITLTRHGDPFEAARQAAGPLSLEKVFSQVREKIVELLQPLSAKAVKDSFPDESWYWAAPVLLDCEYAKEESQAWLDTPSLLQNWAVAGIEDEADEQNHRLLHIRRLQRVADGEWPEGSMPDDLPDVLALLALAGPGITCLRALARVTGGLQRDFRPLLKSATDIAETFRHLYNLPAIQTLIRGCMARRTPTQTPYWRQLLHYGMEGGIQAVLDEYAHYLRDQNTKANEKVVSDLAQSMIDAISLRTAMLAVDDIIVEGDRVWIEKPMRIRTQYALRLADERHNEQQVTRATQVRDAFNSPFWPFILATTSIGQEGLDFHPYCHAIMHWNLPANPVDMEQREGRIHRYKGHAVRKNLAKCFGLPRGHGVDDPWRSLFESGHREQTSDLIPFWLFPLDGGAAIERHVPALPLSRDASRLDALRRSLAVYRMAFGQARQDDLLAYLMGILNREQLEELASTAQIDLAPPVVDLATSAGYAT